MKIFIKIKAKLLAWQSLVFAWIDFRKYAASLASFKKIVGRLPASDKGSLLIVSGRFMNVLLAQTWAVLSLTVRSRGYRGVVLTARSQERVNRYYRLLGLELIFFDEIVKTVPQDLPEDLARAVGAALTFEAFQALVYQETPIGQIALSTYSRNYGTGIIDLNDPKTLQRVREALLQIYQSMLVAEQTYAQFNVQCLFFTEVFMEEYGAFYYAALAKNLNIIRFAGTVRDDAWILQHMTRANDRCHHASLSPSSWEIVKQRPLTPKVEAKLMENFADRYGNKWHRSKRNQMNAKIMSVDEARALLYVKPGRKVAVIYSHILYDTLFFFGTDLFNDYAQWLVETVRVAFQNPDVDWFVKVHPSNLWRGELDTLLGGKYEEERILQKEFGQLPAHVKIVTPDTVISPFTWFQAADYGITVRGTAGLEMAALGKTVITAGTGRYEGNGFTTDPRSKEEYGDILRKLPDISGLSPEQMALAKRYAYAIFVLKPYTLHSLRPRLRTGVKVVRASDDIVQMGVHFQTDGRSLPPDLEKLSAWMLEKENHDLLGEWQ